MIPRSISSYYPPTTLYQLAPSTRSSGIKHTSVLLKLRVKGEDLRDKESFLKNIFFSLSAWQSSNRLEIFKTSEFLSEKESSELLYVRVIQRQWNVSSSFFVNFICFYDWSLQRIIHVSLFVHVFCCQFCHFLAAWIY